MRLLDEANRVGEDKISCCFPKGNSTVLKIRPVLQAREHPNN